MRRLVMMIGFFFVLTGSALAADVRDVDGSGLPPQMTQVEYEYILDMANLTARIYDNAWDWMLDRLAPFLLNKLDFVGNSSNYLNVVRDENVLNYMTEAQRSAVTTLLDTYVGGWDGLDAKVYINIHNPGQLVLVFRGTEALNVNDWIADVRQALNIFVNSIGSVQYEKAVNLAVGLKAFTDANSYTMEIAGHSLGGGLAQITGLKTGVKTTCFNAAGLTAATLVEQGIIDSASQPVTEEMVANITHINVKNCPLVDTDGQMNDSSPFATCPRYGNADKVYWLDHLMFCGGTWNMPLRIANHMYHAYVYQLYQKDFL